MKDCHAEMGKSMGGYHSHLSQNHSGNAVYGLGFIGAAIYFIGKAATFSAGVVGMFKAIVWPAFMIYEAFKFFLG